MKVIPDPFAATAVRVATPTGDDFSTSLGGAYRSAEIRIGHLSEGDCLTMTSDQYLASLDVAAKVYVFPETSPGWGLDRPLTFIARFVERFGEAEENRLSTNALPPHDRGRLPDSVSKGGGRHNSRQRRISRTVYFAGARCVDMVLNDGTFVPYEGGVILIGDNDPAGPIVAAVWLADLENFPDRSGLPESLTPDGLKNIAGVVEGREELLRNLRACINATAFDPFADARRAIEEGERPALRLFEYLSVDNLQSFIRKLSPEAQKRLRIAAGSSRAKRAEDGS